MDIRKQCNRDGKALSQKEKNIIKSIFYTLTKKFSTFKPQDIYGATIKKDIGDWLISTKKLTLNLFPQQKQKTVFAVVECKKARYNRFELLEKLLRDLLYGEVEEEILHCVGPQNSVSSRGRGNKRKVA